MSYITDNSRFTLERYRLGGANRFTCPQCGKKKCFTRYVDNETGEYVADECGKCNHESSCGYHYPPRDFFRDHPELKPHESVTPYYINGSPTVLKRVSPPRAIAPVIAEQTEFFDITWAEKGAQRGSTFRTWFESLPYDEELKKAILAEYLVGGTAKDMILSGNNYGPAVVFWMIDEQQRVHDAKIIAYKSDGHRVPDWANSMRAICKKSGVGPQLEYTDKVLFGLHLLPKYPDKVVCIVESEKSALVCACRYPQFLWLATGGCSNLQPEKLRPLMDRRVVVYPDSGEHEKWKAKMVACGHENYAVVDFLEEYVPNTDIADIILGEAILKSENEQYQAFQRLKDENPVIQQLADDFDLELVAK